LKLGFGKPKQKNSPLETNTDSVVANRLKELCGGDSDLYGAMSRLMFLDPKKITTPLDRGYRIAGGISLYRGDLDGVKKYFEKAASFAGDSHPEYQIILKRSDEAVKVARKFYDEFGSLSMQS